MPKSRRQTTELYECHLYGKGIGRPDLKEVLHVKASNFEEARLKAVEKAYDLFPDYEWACGMVHHGVLVQPSLPGFEKPGNDFCEVA